MIAATRLGPLAFAALLGACVELPDFPEASRVASPRVLAVVAEPPEVNPGEPVSLSLITAGAEDVTARWSACGAFDSFIGGGAQYADAQDDEGCEGRGLALGEGTTAVLPGQLGRGLFDNLELAARILGQQLPEDTVRKIRESVGLPFLIEARVTADGKSIRALKRVLISQRATPNQNPPAPRFAFGKTDIVPDPSDPLRCVAAESGTARAAPDTDVELAPETEGEMETWLESYEVLDAHGALQQRTERAFYSWFSTGGEFEQQVTKSPLRNEVWRTPRLPGTYPLWLIVRDGHGGASGCMLEVVIEK